MPPLQVLDKPEDLKTLLKEDRGDDCLSCKIVGELSSEPLTEVKERKTKSHPPQAPAHSSAWPATATGPDTTNSFNNKQRFLPAGRDLA